MLDQLEIVLFAIPIARMGAIIKTVVFERISELYIDIITVDCTEIY